jgi:hypothetical protein
MSFDDRDTLKIKIKILKKEKLGYAQHFALSRNLLAISTLGKERCDKGVIIKRKVKILYTTPNNTYSECISISHDIMWK